MAERQQYSVSVNTSPLPTGTRFIVAIQPIPVMKWHEVPNARESIRDIIARSSGLPDRKQGILQGVMALLRQWGDQGKMYPSHWVDGDDYIPMMSTRQPEPPKPA